MAEEATSLDAVIKLLGLVTGSGKQTTSQTTSGGMSQEGLAAILKQSLESNQGLAQLLGGQNAAGLYNSSTNQLLANDLVSRLTAQAQANSINRTTTTTQQTAGPLQNLSKGQINAGASAAILKSLLSTGSKVATDSKAQSQIGAGFEKVKNLFAGSEVAANAGADVSAIGPEAAALSDVGSIQFPTLGGTDSLVTNSGSMDFISNLAGNLGTNDSTAMLDYFSGNSAESAPAVEETASNFRSATSATGSQTSGIGSGSSELTSTADVATVGTTGYNSIVTSGQGLGTATDGISYASAPSSTGSLDVGYDLGSGLGEVSGEAGTAAAGSAASTDILGGSGSSLGYLGSAMYALNAPEAEYGKDYRQAVGSAVLNWFGYGWATPIVDAVARPVLDSAMDSGNQSLGDFGTVLADPVGAPLSGQYDVGGLITSTLDPANVWGGNEGGSTGQLAAALLMPENAMIGGDGIFNSVADTINAVESSDPIGSAVSDLLGGGGGGGGLPGLGKVICTELAFQDHLNSGLYKLATSDALAMKPQVLRGYHVIGVRVVPLLRKYPKFAAFLGPYTAKYIQHKAGQWNWRGWLIKSILHPVSWCLGFFNRDPDYYKVLYRRERKPRERKL